MHWKTNGNPLQFSCLENPRDGGAWWAAVYGVAQNRTRPNFTLYGVREFSNFILLHIADQFSQHHLLKRLSFLHCIFLPPLSKIRCPEVCGFISGLSLLFHWSIFLSLCQYYTVLMTVAAFSYFKLIPLLKKWVLIVDSEYEYISRSVFILIYLMMTLLKLRI